MAEMVKKRRLINPGRRRRRRNPRKMSALQRMFFGTKRQRAAVKANRSRRRRHNASFRKTKKSIKTHWRKHGVRGTVHKTKRLDKIRRKYGIPAGSWRGRAINPRRRKRRRNISSIVTVYPAPNPGRRRRRRTGGVTVARRRRRLNPRRYHRRRRNAGTARGRSWSFRSPRALRAKMSRNPGRRRRRRNVHHRRHYRRNPMGLHMTGTMTSVLGVLGGLALTRTICTFVPAQFATGILGYAATGIIAVGQGQLVGKVSKNAMLGHYFMVGGLAYMVNKMLNDFIPTLGGYTGIGLIGGSSFYVPQVNMNGSMGSFVLPGAVTGAIGAAMVPATTTTGVRGLRRTGRVM